MSTYRNTAEGGTNGTTVTTANSGGASGNAFTAAGGMVFSNTHSAHGSLSMKDTVGTSSVVRWAITNDGSVSMRAYYWLDATPTQNLMRLAHATDTTASTVLINTANKLRLNAKSSTQLWVATNNFPTAQWVRVEAYFIQGTTTTSGQARIAYYVGDSTTATEDSGLITGANFGGDLGLFTQARFGTESTTTTVVGYFDDLAVNVGADSTGFIGPVPADGASPFKRWTGTAYKDLDAYRWNGTGYTPLLKVNP